MSDSIHSTQDRDQFWLVVEDCLVEFHAFPRPSAQQEVAALAEKIDGLDTEAIDLFFHGEPFDVACQIAKTPLDVADYLSRYLALRDQSVPQVR